MLPNGSIPERLQVRRQAGRYPKRGDGSRIPDRRRRRTHRSGPRQHTPPDSIGEEDGSVVRTAYKSHNSDWSVAPTAAVANATELRHGDGERAMAGEQSARETSPMT